MKRFLLVALLFVPLMLTGCLSYDDIQVLNVKDVSYEELKGTTLRLSFVATVNNPNYYSVKVKNAKMNLHLQDRVLGNVTQIEHIEIKGRTKKDYKIHISVEIKDMLSSVLSLSRVLMNDPSSLSLSGTVQAKTFFTPTKTIKIDQLSFQ